MSSKSLSSNNGANLGPGVRATVRVSGARSRRHRLARGPVRGLLFVEHAGDNFVRRRRAIPRCMIPTHATKAGIRYRYYVSLPHLKGESKTVSVGSVSRIPATDIEDIIVRSVNEHLVTRHGQPTSSSAQADDRGVIAEQVVRIDVHKDRLLSLFKLAGTEKEPHSTESIAVCDRSVALTLSFRLTILDRDRSALNPTEFVQSLQKCGGPVVPA
jgi:hypothetical protein